jgi:4-hydroxymandelate synthase
LQDIAYLEFSAQNQDEVVDYFSRSFAFTAVATCDEPGKQATLLRQGRVRLIVSSGPAAAEFLGTHGDGISDIAFVCDDIAATVERAVAVGARRLGPATLSGFGDVRHTLLPSKPAIGARGSFPDGRRWVQLPRRDAGREAFVRDLDHIAVCVEAGALHDTVFYYEHGFDLKQYSTEYVEFGAQAMDSVVVRSGSDRVTFTIIEPDRTRAPGQVNEFLTRNGGAGVQHLAFLVDDIVGAVRGARDRGLEFLSTPDAYYSALPDRVGHLDEAIADLRDTHVLADRDEWGYLLQLFSRSPHSRNTIFYELIQRHGAHGFGINNIRALYESVERGRDR